MRRKKDIDLIKIGYHKGELDFSVLGTVADLPWEEQKKLREMIVVAIYVAEDMWRRNHEALNWENHEALNWELEGGEHKHDWREKYSFKKCVTCGTEEELREDCCICDCNHCLEKKKDWL